MTGSDFDCFVFVLFCFSIFKGTSVFSSDFSDYHIYCNSILSYDWSDYRKFWNTERWKSFA